MRLHLDRNHFNHLDGNSIALVLIAFFIVLVLVY
jgi:F0F1-type ATP synthase membrane subunit b/b'